MRIGIDLGGSHIAIGLVENGKILQKQEHNFSKQEKEELENTITEFIHREIKNILQTIPLGNIENIGLSVPRKT